MRNEPFLIPALIATAAVSAQALERTSVRADAFEREDWSAAQTCTVRYYNNCTGWVWVWSGWSPGEKIGTVYHSCCSQAVLQLTWYLTFDAIPSGWGTTGTIEIFDVQGNECPTGAPLARQPFFPPLNDGWHPVSWIVPVPQDFLVRVSWGGFTGWTNPTGMASDHPFAGPTGPTACGACFPSDRVVSSFHYGTPGQPECPGVTLNDGLCDVEWMMDTQLACPVHTDSRSWGKIKSLYE